MDKINIDKKELLKKIILDLHNGEDIEIIKKRFSNLIKDVNASEISEIEQSLIDEGLPEEEVKELCDVHVSVFKESLDKKKKLNVPKGHPIHTLMLENRESEKILYELKNLINEIAGESNIQVFKSNKKKFLDVVDNLSEINKHYLRKENQLFPSLESHNVSGPTQVMWAIHDDIRAKIKKLKQSITDDNIPEIISSWKVVNNLIEDMIYKEENILYPMSLETLDNEDWKNVKDGENEIGFSWIKPLDEWISKKSDIDNNILEEKSGGLISLDTGKLSIEQINLMLKHLPIDISFVNDKDEVVYYSDTPERIFPRSEGVIGRKVQKCHPPKSVHVVENIIKQFKEGKKDVAEFWINLNDKIIHIRYFAVRNKKGKYLGILEISQEITDIKNIEGEKRLLDWN